MLRRRIGHDVCFGSRKILQQLVLTANGFSQHRIDAVRLCWVFDRVRIFLAVRPDDVCLGVIVENQPGTVFDGIERTLQEFLTLQQV
jgi:hypothetical protein